MAKRPRPRKAKKERALPISPACHKLPWSANNKFPLTSSLLGALFSAMVA